MAAPAAKDATDSIVDLGLSLFSQGQIRVVRGPRAPEHAWGVQPASPDTPSLQAVAPIGDVPDEVFQMFMAQLHQYSHVRLTGVRGGNGCG